MYKLGRIERGCEVYHVDQVVWDPGTFFQRGFGGAKVQTAINLHGIDRNDFAVKFVGQKEGDLGFAHRGGTRETKNASLSA
jgi:hypothetical protein